jgi:uncharacterized protein YnzC (UPF0291/DUF896 family)
MLLRNVNERLQIISRKDCKNETEYNKKLYNLRLEYMGKYKSVFINTINTINTINNTNTVKTDSLEQLQTKSEEI